MKNRQTRRRSSSPRPILRFCPRRLLGVALFLAVAGLAACGDDPAPFDIHDVQFDPELGVDLDAMEERSSGLFLETLEEGEPDAQVAADGDEVWYHYVLWLPDGTEIQDSRDPQLDGPFTFEIGAGEVFPGFEEGVEGMAVGETRLLVIPPSLSDGVNTVVFEVVLLSIGEAPPEEAGTE